ncbi:MAG: UDP-N-acetylmuramoyl-L-alanine--D-glutamate ligase [bacterium]|nr:UDP-N-acetylmuramoyl-L-alanine--D-glutamate ligase [bacterium]
MGKRVTVMGLGLHGGGLAVTAWFLTHGAMVTVTDRKTAGELAPSVRALAQLLVRHPAFRERLHLVLGKHRMRDFTHADLVVQNPGVPRESPYLAAAARAGVAIENEASLFFRILKGVPSPPQIMAVTGTRGKSTTAALLHQMVLADGRKAYLAGNIRRPMFDQIAAIMRAARRQEVFVVLELSSWHCERLSRQTGGPDVAIVTNIMRDHLNRYASMRSYAAAKRKILSGSGIAVLNRQSPPVRAMAGRATRKVVWFATSRKGVDNPSLRGAHNRENIAAAAAAARVVGVAPAAIARALQTYVGLPGRLEPVSRAFGITWINDTCATTPDATIAGLKALNSGGGGEVVLIAGGTDKNLVYGAWAQVVACSVKQIIFLPGTATEKMLASLQALPHVEVPVTIARSMREAVRKARRAARRGDTVLLSPGAASFGLFVHEFDRGEQFLRAVRRK